MRCQIYFKHIIILIFSICLNDLLAAILDDTNDVDHSQSIRHVKGGNWELVILRTPGNNLNLVVKRVDDTLNLTCRIQPRDSENGSSPSFEETDKVFKLSWLVNSHETKSKNRIKTIQEKNSLQLIVYNLSDSDVGTYSCRAEEISGNHDGTPYSDDIEVRVIPKKGVCNESKYYSCPSGECINTRFLCDGKRDCSSGSDESSTKCHTTNPCQGKLQCDDGRCISVASCCDRQLDANCNVTLRPKCCLQLQSIQLSLDVSQYTTQTQPYNDMGFLQTTVYTVIGCAMAFMFIITILVIAICRVHLKRTALARYPRQNQDTWASMLMQPRVGPYLCNSSGLMVAYNINNGVQFVARPGPPPYSETIQGPLFDRMLPPPPYSSTDNLVSAMPPQSNSQPVRSPTRQYGREPEQETMEPLLTEDNNNGDVNGNNVELVPAQPGIHVPIESIASDSEEERASTQNNESTDQQPPMPPPPAAAN